MRINNELITKAEELLHNKDAMDKTVLSQQLKNVLTELVSNLKDSKYPVNAEIDQSFYSDIFNSAPVAFVILNQDYKITSVNRTAGNMLGYSEEELYSKSFISLIHPLYQESFAVALNETHNATRQTDLIYDLEIKKSDFSFLSVNIHAQLPTEINRDKILLTIKDRTTQNTIENTLISETEKAIINEQLFKFIADNSSDGIIMTSANGDIHYVSPTYLNQLGFKESHHIGNNINDIIDLVHSEDKDRLIEKYSIAPKNQIKSDSVSFRIKHKNGHYIWRENRISFLYNHLGDHINTIEVCRDITNRKESEKKYLEQSDTLNQIFKNAPYVLIMLNQQLEVVNINEEGIEFTQRSFEEIKGKRGGVIFNCINSFSQGGCGNNPDCNNCSVRKAAKYTIETGESIIAKESDLTVLWNGKPKELNLLISTTPIILNGEKNVLLSIVDNTKRKKTEKELNKVAKLESLGVLAGGIAHNFKNILTAMSLSTEIIRKKPEKTESHLKKIANSIAQATSLVTKFQTFSKGGAPELRSTALHQVIKDSTDIVLSGSSCTVNYSFNEDIKSVMLDDKQMQEVFMNILINAEQAMPRGGKINISTKLIELQKDNKFKLDKGEYIQIDFLDEGVGIPKEHLDEIFTPFFTTKARGQGLGLSSVFYIVSKHRGKIIVESAPGLGSVFSIYLPFVPVETGSKEERKEPELQKQHLIYLLDDDIQILDSIKDFAEVFDLNMTTFSDPHQIIEAYSKEGVAESVSLVILDLTLKGFKINGHDVLLELKKINPKIKAVVFSGHSTIPIVAKYKEYGFDGRIQKPFNMNQFVSEIETILGK